MIPQNIVDRDNAQADAQTNSEATRLAAEKKAREGSATDIDRKNMKIRSSNSKQTINAFLATVHIQDWMRREKFGTFLNEWGRVLSRYGSAVVKFVEKERIIVDPVDFDANPKFIWHIKKIQ